MTLISVSRTPSGPPAPVSGWKCVMADGFQQDFPLGAATSIWAPNRHNNGGVGMTADTGGFNTNEDAVFNASQAILGPNGVTLRATYDPLHISPAGSVLTGNATLTSAVSTGSPTSSLAITGLTVPSISGQVRIIDPTGAHTDLVTLSSSVSAGASSMAITPQTLSFAYPIGSWISIVSYVSGCLTTQPASGSWAGGQTGFPISGFSFIPTIGVDFVFEAVLSLPGIDNPGGDMAWWAHSPNGTNEIDFVEWTDYTGGAPGLWASHGAWFDHHLGTVNTSTAFSNSTPSLSAQVDGNLHTWTTWFDSANSLVHTYLDGVELSVLQYSWLSVWETDWMPLILSHGLRQAFASQGPAFTTHSDVVVRSVACYQPSAVAGRGIAGGGIASGTLLAAPPSTPVLPPAPVQRAYGYQIAPWDSPLSLGVQAFIEYNGYIINDRHQADRIRVTSITGLDDSDISDSREVIPGDEGEFVYDSWARGRTFVMTGQIQAGSMGTLKRLERDLKAAFGTLQESPMKFRWFDVYDSFDTSDTLLNYTAVIGAPSISSITPASGVLMWGTTNNVLLMRSADNRLWADAQTTLRIVVGSVTDTSEVYLVPALSDDNNFVKVSYTPNVVDVNGAPDPSFAHDTIGVAPGNGWATYGTNSLGVIAGAGPFPGITQIVQAGYGNDLRLASANTETTYAPGETRTISAFVYIPSFWNGGQITIDNDYGGTSTNKVFANMALTNQWQRISATVTAGGSGFNGGVFIRTASAPTPGLAINISAVMETPGSDLLDYGDGDDPAWVWLGTPGNSASKRTELTISTVIGGTSHLISGAPVTGIARGQSIWLRTKKEGDLITGEVWTTPPAETAIPTFSTSAFLGGSDADLLGDQVLTQVGFGAQVVSAPWALDDFRISTICPCDISFMAKKLSSISIKDSQDSLTRFNRSFQITMRASQPNGKCATQSRSLTLVPSSGGTELGFTAPIVAPFSARSFVSGTVSLQNSILSVCNRGTAPDRPIIVFFGATTGFSLINLINDQQINWSGTLADGDYLVFDCRRRTLVNSAGVDMKAFISFSDSRWMLLEPQWNDIYVSGAGYSDNTRVVMFYRGSWK